MITLFSPPVEPPRCVMSRGNRIYTRLTCPRCLRPVLNICANCSSEAILLAEDPEALDPITLETGKSFNPLTGYAEPAWLYICSVCRYVGYGQYCSACLCFLPMNLFIDPPPCSGLWLVLLICFVLGGILIYQN